MFAGRLPVQPGLVAPCLGAGEAVCLDSGPVEEDRGAGAGLLSPREGGVIIIEESGKLEVVLRLLASAGAPP